MNALLLVVGLLSAAAHTALGSFCGKSGVPYSFEVLQTGAPVLGCAQPSCVISATDAEGDFQEDSQFFTDAGGQADGFFRDGDRAIRRFRHGSAPKLIANCSGQFNELSCPRKNQWVGGIEYIDHPRQPLVLQCCTFEGLRFSQEVGSTTIGPGEAITGGEVVRGGRQISFDVIANVRKVVKSEADSAGGKVSYEVTVRRMNCLPDPPEPEVELDADVPSEVSKILGSAKNKELADKSAAANGGRKQPAQKARKDKQQQQKAKQQAALTEQLPEISGGEGDRAAASAGRNSEASIQPKVNQRQPPRQPQPQQQQQFVPQQQQQQFNQQNESNGNQQQFVPDQQQQQQFNAQQQQQQQFLPAQERFGPQQQQLGGAFAESTTIHPLFGTHSFPTLPPHSFPTLPPHTFPTLPPHSFPTLPPHTFPPHSFPTLPPHTFPTLPPAHTFPGIFSGTQAPQTAGFGTAGGGSSGAQAFAAPSNSVGAPIPLGQQQSGGGGHQQQYYQSAGNAQQVGGRQQFQQPYQQQQQQFQRFQPQQSAPRMAPAMGTILAAMTGERRPIMHPVWGLIGYSNGPQMPGMVTGKK